MFISHVKHNEIVAVRFKKVKENFKKYNVFFCVHLKRIVMDKI